MNKPLSMPARRDLRQRMIEDMSIRGFSAKTQHEALSREVAASAVAP
jgi:hypothetical protein